MLRSQLSKRPIGYPKKPGFWHLLLLFSNIRMKYNPEIHHRRSIRLPSYDYSQPGAYFITLCTTKKQCWFGQIKDEKMHINQLGKIVQNEWLKSAQLRQNLRFR